MTVSYVGCDFPNPFTWRNTITHFHQCCNMQWHRHHTNVTSEKTCLWLSHLQQGMYIAHQWETAEMWHLQQHRLHLLIWKYIYGQVYNFEYSNTYDSFVLIFGVCIYKQNLFVPHMYMIPYCLYMYDPYLNMWQLS